MRIVFKRYASLYFIVGIERDDNELLALTFIQMYVEALDQYFGKDDVVDPLTNDGAGPEPKPDSETKRGG